MKRTFYYSTAILALTAFQTANAQEWDLAVHGYFNQHTGYASNDFDAGSAAVLYNGYRERGDYDEAIFYTDAEIHFTPSITLDNGLTFGVNIQLEADNNMGDDIDESYMEIKGDRFGKLVLGSENSAGYKMMVAAPSVTSMPIDSPSISAYVPFSGVYSGGFREAGLSSATEVAGNNDAQRITYFSPSFNGFMVGVSYAPTGKFTNGAVANGGSRNNGVFDRKESLNDIVDIAASYTQTFGDFDVAIAGRYGFSSWGKNVDRDGGGNKIDDPTTWGVGAQFGYMGFTIGGSYAENDNGVKGGEGDSTGWSVGMSYEFQNPWSVEAVTYQGKADNGPEKEKYQAYRIGASRDLGPGVDFDLYGLYVKADNGYSSGSRMDADVEGWGLGTAINLSF